MKKSEALAICWLSMVLPILSHAHVDTTLRLDGNTLDGLPAEFAPAELDWGNKVLRVGKHRIDLNAFENIIPFQPEYEIFITASWYHERSILPPYICINLRPKGRTFKYTIMLNLDTLELLEVMLVYRINLEQYATVVRHELKLREHDINQIKRRTTKIK